MRKYSFLQILIGAVVFVVALVGFQNCSKVSFNSDPGALNSLNNGNGSGNDGGVDNGVPPPFNDAGIDPVTQLTFNDQDSKTTLAYEDIYRQDPNATNKPDFDYNDFV